MREPVGLREVAQAAGVGLATASRALAGRDRVSSATRQRVAEVARLLGWLPDPALARLSLRRRRAASMHGRRVAFLHLERSPLPTGAEASVPFLRSAAKRAGLHLAHVAMDAHADAASLLQTMQEQGCIGAVVHLLHAQPYALDSVWSRLPAVALGAATVRPAIPLAGADGARQARAVWRLVLGQGWRRIGIALPAWPPSDGQADLLGGLLAEREQLAASQGIPVLRYAPDDPQAMLTWQRQHRVEAGVVFDPEAGAVLAPTGCAVACLAVFRPQDRGRWAGAYFDWEVVASQAIRLLHTMIRSGLSGHDLCGISQLVALPAQPGRSLPLAGRLTQM